MNWNDVPANELLKKLDSENIDDGDRDRIINDYLVAKHERLEKEPLTLLPILEEIYRVKSDKLRVEKLNDEDFETVANDCVFLSLWIGRIYLKNLKNIDECQRHLELAKSRIELYDGDYLGNLREDNLKGIDELGQQIKEEKKRAMQQNEKATMEKGSRIPEAFEEHLALLEKKRIFKDNVNKNVGQTRHYGYLLTGNSGTGKRTSAKLLYDALRAIDIRL